MYLDKYGLIVQKDGDGGDSLQRAGFVAEAEYLRSEVIFHPMNHEQATRTSFNIYKHRLDVLKVPESPIRHPDPQDSTPPHNDPSDTSRDQISPNIRAMGYFHMNGALIDLICKYMFKYPNGDFSFLHDHSRNIRALKLWGFYPMVILGDLFLLLGAIIRVIQAKLNPEDVDDLNLIGDLAQAQYILPTPISFIARKLYKWLRPKGPQYALDWYFRAEAGGNPEIAKLWAPIVERF